MEGLCLRYFCCCVFSPLSSILPRWMLHQYSDRLVGLVPYGWYPQTQSTGWPPIHSRTYPRTTLLVLLLLACGDIQKNPGPMDPCSVCGKRVRDNQDGLFCEVCLNWAHRHCVKMSESEYYHWANIEDGWICLKCEKESFPYHDVSTLPQIHAI